MPSDRGAFITLEGADGSGKSTQAAMLVCRLRESGFEVVSLREPGGTSISEKIRGLLLDPANAEMSDECELLLYEASRAQLVREVVEPALERGAVVVCDRSGGRRTYTVRDVFQVEETATWKTIASRVTGYGESVVLQTCAGDGMNVIVVAA